MEKKLYQVVFQFLIGMVLIRVAAVENAPKPMEFQFLIGMVLILEKS